MAGMGTRGGASSDEMGNLEEQMKKLDMGEKRDINILLLGETGVGKSTFINAFCNYLQFANLRFAMKGKLITLIPTKFTITDENYEEQTVQVGADANEFVETGMSATQASRSYVFPIRKGKVRVRLIDTPGIGDTRGIEQDNINFENVLSFIGELKHLNAICILLKPNNARLTVMFEFCIKQLLSRLEKSASKNLVFVFTNSRSTFYRPGETLPALKKLLESVHSVKIPVVKDNIFCMDNEAFRFLAAVSNGIKFSEMDTDNFAQSWKKSFHECWRMISYIAGDATKSPLVPHLVKNTISVNEARRLIVQLSQPLAEIAQLIQDNITVLQRHKASLERSDSSLADLKKKLYVPVMNLRVIKMDQPTTVCTSSKCRTLYQVGSLQKWHYHQRCHRPCYLTNVPKEIVGSPEIASCYAMGGTMSCRQCSCPYQVHMHIYFETETYEEKLENEAIKSEISDKNLALMQARNVVIKIERRLKEYSEERDSILKTTAKFAHFLQKNAITPYNDAYQSYLRYLIDREESLGPNADDEIIKEFKRMLKQYNEEKNALNLALAQTSDGVTSITADEIINCVESLYNLKHNGLKIQELFHSQKTARKDENQSETREYVHATAQKKQKKKKRNKNKQVNDTTDSEYATDAGQNQNYNRRFNNRQNFGPNQQYNQRRPYNQQYNQHQPYNQHQQYNQQQQYSNPQQTGMPNNQQKTVPVQYLQIKQDPSGQFDLRFGSSNQDRSQSPMPHDHQSLQNAQNGGQYGAYPKTYNAGPPQNQLYNKNFQHGGNQRYGQNRARSTPRSHSPNPRYQSPNPYNPSPQNYNQFQGSNQGGGPINQGQNQRGRPFNQGPNQGGRPFNQGQNQGGGPFNQGPNQGGRPFNQGQNQGGRPFNQGPNQGGRPFNHYGPKQFNQNPAHFNQGPKSFNEGPALSPLMQGQHNPFNQGWQNSQNQGQRRKSLNNNQKLLTAMQSDSGCESGGYGGPRFGRNQNRGNSKMHCLEDSSSSSSSESSSDDESYVTCR